MNVSRYNSIPVIKGVFAIQFYSAVSPKPVHFSKVRWIDDISELNLGKNEYICSELFKIQIVKFSLKEKTMRKLLHNQSVSELAHCVMVFYTQELGTCFGDTGILVWHLFSLGLLKPLLLHLI